MKLRESGMPDEAMWGGLFDVPLILDRMGIDSAMGDVAELGCGYGTFTIPVARRIGGVVEAFDVDERMVERTLELARAGGIRNVRGAVRDVAAEGFGGAAGSRDACLLFNILHGEGPEQLYEHAADAVREGGLVLAIHWRHDPSTPRGPSMEIRPRPEQLIEWGEKTGRLRYCGPVIDLPLWHYGVRFVKIGNKIEIGKSS